MDAFYYYRLGTDVGTSGMLSDVGFAGREWDNDSDLYYNRARWYDSNTGRFIGVDPIEDGNNWYVYAGSDPVNYRDPTGLSAAHPLQSLGNVVGSVASSVGTSISQIAGGLYNQVSPTVDSIAFSFSYFQSQYDLYGPATGGASTPSFNSDLTSQIIASGIGSSYGSLATPNDFGSSSVSSASSFINIDSSLGDYLDPAFDFGGLTIPSPREVTSVTQIGGRSLGDYVLGDVQGTANQILNTSTNPFEAFNVQLSATVLGIAKASLDAIGPAPDPSHQVDYSDGTSTIRLKGVPSSGALAEQASIFFAPFALQKGASTRSGVDYDVSLVPGPNPNNLRQRVVTSPTAGEGGVYLKPQNGRTKVGSTNDYRSRYGANALNGIEVEIPTTRTGPATNDTGYKWTPRRQRRFDEEYIDRTTPTNVRYRNPNNPKSPVDPSLWEQYRSIFGYGDLPTDYGL